MIGNKNVAQLCCPEAIHFKVLRNNFFQTHCYSILLYTKSYVVSAFTNLLFCSFTNTVVSSPCNWQHSYALQNCALYTFRRFSKLNYLMRIQKAANQIVKRLCVSLCKLDAHLLLLLLFLLLCFCRPSYFVAVLYYNVHRVVYKLSQLPIKCASTGIPANFLASKKGRNWAAKSECGKKRSNMAAAINFN